MARLGIDGRLAVTLTTSNPIESMLSIVRTTNRNVTRWRDGQMVLRWTAAGMLNAEQSFRRVKATNRCPSSSPRAPAYPPRNRYQHKDRRCRRPKFTTEPPPKNPRDPGHPPGTDLVGQPIGVRAMSTTAR